MSKYATVKIEVSMKSKFQVTVASKGQVNQRQEQRVSAMVRSGHMTSAKRYKGHITNRRQLRREGEYARFVFLSVLFIASKHERH